MYNIIAYISFIVSWLIAVCIFIDWLFIPNLLPQLTIDSNYLVWALIMFGFNQIYIRLATVFFPDIIKEWWINRKIQKSKESGEEQPKTYKDFKES